MIRSIVSVGLIVLSSFILRVRCLSAIQGSPCYSTCNGDQATSSGDIVCIDDDFQNTRKGRLLSTCMNCLRRSTFKTDIIGDGVLFLYYMSSVQQTCLSGRPGAPISDCSGLCGDLSSAFSSIGGRGFFQSPYTFCNISNNVYENDAPDCARCLRGQDGTVVLGNFVYLGNKACMDQPDILNGQSIMGSDSLFNITKVNISSGGGSNATVTPSPNSTRLPTTSGTAASTSGAQSSQSSSTTAASNVKDTETSGGDNGLSRGAAAGIGLVLGVIGIAAIVVFALMARRRMVMKQSGGIGPVAANRPWKRMHDGPEMRNSMAPPPPLPPMVDRGATPPAAGVFVPPVPQIPRTPRTPKTSKSFRSLRSLKSLKLTPRSYYAANPKSSADVTALPQRGWD